MEIKTKATTDSVSREMKITKNQTITLQKRQFLIGHNKGSSHEYGSSVIDSEANYSH